MQSKIFTFFTMALIICLYFLEGILFNPLIIWTALPIYLAFFIFKSAAKAKLTQKIFAAYFYLLGSAGYSLYYHILWYFDIDGTKTAGSTSALIFIVFPVFAIVIGALSWLFGYFVGVVYESEKNS
ncbi:hypothetical protein [Rheinheimera sp. 4Y26]|uniref:hypothetical protein n=1 Tax=Rheinheimera sp. 4Y26 TaxID=2977811 RepID=UPI0021B154E2|nr:hypothetical protein [Rheinheimera sp. 4Y26]MCT6699965.1 hypothetical protein [Rheinheimera sp. 4Y26]